MSKRFFLVSLIVIGLICSGFSFVVNSGEISNIKPVVSLKNYNAYPEVTQNGFVFHMYLEVEKDSKEFSTSDFGGYIGSKTMDSLNYSVSKKIVSEDKDVLLFDYMICTPFFVGSFDFIPQIKSFSYPEYGWFHSGWSGKLRIDLDHTQVPSDLVNFPVLINISSLECIYDYVQADGDDLFFTTDDDCFKYNHELEYFSAGGGVVDIVAWVNVTSLPHDYDLVINMYYGNAGASNQEHVTDTWDANYMGVWHMNDATTSTVLDSTSNDNDGTKLSANNPLTTSSGKVGYAQDFSSDYIDFGTSATLKPTTAATFEIWAHVDNTDTKQFFSSRDGVSINNYQIYWGSSDRISSLFWGLSTINTVTTSGNLGTSSYGYVVTTYDGSKTECYLNSVDNGGLATSGSIDSGAAASLRTGGDHYGNFYDGRLDELRISDIARSVSWITTSYNTVFNSSTGCANPFITLYSCRTNSLPAVSNPVPANHSLDVSVSQADFCINITDDWCNFNYTIECSNGDTVSVDNATNGTKCLTLASGLICETNYTVWVNVTEYCWCAPSGGYGRTAYYWYWFITEDCDEEPEPSFNMSFTALLGDIDTCPCCISLCFNISSDNDFANVTLNSNYTGVWSPMQEFNDLANGTYCFVIYNWTRYNYTYYFNYTFNNGVNFSDSTTYYIETVNLSDCNNILGDTMEINIEISQLVMLILLGCWLFFTYLFYTQRQKEKILAWVQFAFTMPLSFIIAGVVAPYPMGYAVAVTIPLLSIIILVDAYYGR